ncbi:hypothetical protein OEZ85_012923 [Tetradesmus obliquus]|uniref:Uncharacterized protein n=1 Tax=Tetradesmus obliquus TaxID=3088 RepID=A0ABY8U4B8_TETOB|nr:hypothetical protein OEZ85_012923 [Tetradesmus obliquus]
MAPRCYQCWFVLLAAVLVLLAAEPGAVGLPAQVSDPTVCIADGINSTAQYRHTVRLGRYFLPIYTTVNLSKPVTVDNILIIQHGAGGEANNFFCDAVAGTSSLNSTAVIAPYFGNETVLQKDWLVGSASNRTSLFWNATRWNQGAASLNAPNISSFDALDALLHLVTRCPNRTCAKQVTVAGFSAGGQTVQRYAWASSYGAANSTRRVQVKFVVSDPGTYLYFDTQRPKSSCRPRQDTGPSWSCSSFGDYMPFASACPAFNDYKLGLNNLNTSSPYFTRLVGSPAAMSAAYLAKNILYVLGEADVCNCLSSGVTNPAVCFRANQSCSPVGNGNNASCCDMPAPQPINAMVDIACGDMLQGSNRLQRGLLFMSYLKTFSNGSASPQFTTVPGMGHDASKLYSVQKFLNFVSSL